MNFNFLCSVPAFSKLTGAAQYANIVFTVPDEFTYLISTSYVLYLRYTSHTENKDLLYMP